MMDLYSRKDCVSFTGCWMHVTRGKITKVTEVSNLRPVSRQNRPTQAQRTDQAPLLERQTQKLETMQQTLPVARDASPAQELALRS